MLDHGDDDPTSEADPGIADDGEEEDEIMTELRQIRREIMAEFNNDFEAYFRHIQEREEEARKRGVRFVSGPVGKFVRSPDTGAG
jgi:hypothetical protein